MAKGEQVTESCSHSECSMDIEPPPPLSYLLTLSFMRAKTTRDPNGQKHRCRQENKGSP